MILETFTNFLEKFEASEESMQKMNKFLEIKLTNFLVYMEDPNNELRFQACRLHQQMFLRGMISTSEAVRKFITQQSDSNPNIIALSARQLLKISKNRLNIIQQILSCPSQVLENLYEHQIKIGLSEASGL